jgi:hypothetical protein
MAEAEVTQITISYDDKFDVLEVFFQKPEAALTVELEEDVYAHVIPSTQRVIGFTIHHFRSHPRPFPLPLQGGVEPATPTTASIIRKALVPA